MTDYCAGIDLGTTNTVLGVWMAGAATPVVVPIAQPYDDLTAQGVRENPLLDSVVTIHEGQVYVGFLARQIGLVGGARSFSSTKRFMGHHWFRRHQGFGWTPERVAACILRVIFQELLRRFDALPNRVVVTIPASFGTEARRATLVAARLAGFDPARLSLFDEPTSALLAEMQDPHRYRDSDCAGLHAVVDVGGGTLDVSLVRVNRDGKTTVFDVIGQSRYNGRAAGSHRNK